MSVECWRVGSTVLPTIHRQDICLTDVTAGAQLTNVAAGPAVLVTICTLQADWARAILAAVAVRFYLDSNCLFLSSNN